MNGDKTQQLIIRQSSLRSAVEFLKKEEKADTEDAINVAKQFEQYVTYGDYLTQERKKELDDIVAEAIAKGDEERKLKEEQK